MTERVVSTSRVIHATPEAIFEVLTDPAKHPLIDGSGSVKKSRGDEDVRLALGSKFGMSMKLGMPYRISNTVKEFEENRLIAWAHFGGHRWRYQLEPTEEGTLVTESFDWSTAKLPKFIELAGYPKRHLPNMERTLEQLAQLVET